MSAYPTDDPLVRPVPAPLWREPALTSRTILLKAVLIRQHVDAPVFRIEYQQLVIVYIF
jgi:hypothetical protein